MNIQWIVLDVDGVLSDGTLIYTSTGEELKAFSVKDGVKIPPSLQNIYKELNSDLGLAIPKTGYLKSWADEG
ncbi:MAG: hypothetical protein E6297_03105, partial [Veillonella sp.]|nr:hypothetical protein [Veillonella sp.]